MSDPLRSTSWRGCSKLLWGAEFQFPRLAAGTHPPPPPHHHPHPQRARPRPRPPPPAPSAPQSVDTHPSRCAEFLRLAGRGVQRRKGANPGPNQSGCNVGPFRKFSLSLLSGLLVKIVNIRPV